MTENRCSAAWDCAPGLSDTGQCSSKDREDQQQRRIECQWTYSRIGEQHTGTSWFAGHPFPSFHMMVHRSGADSRGQARDTDWTSSISCDIHAVVVVGMSRPETCTRTLLQSSSSGPCLVYRVLGPVFRGEIHILDNRAAK